MDKKTIGMLFVIFFFLISFSVLGFAQIPMKTVLNRITVASENDTRGLVDLVGFPHKAEQMNFIGKFCEEQERTRIQKNQEHYGLSEQTRFIFGICPHDDYKLAGRVYVHIQKYIRAKTAILIGNSHWSETFGVRNKLIFGNFKQWRGPYGPVTVSSMRNQMIDKLPDSDYTVNRKLVETEHSLEALIPFLQYYNRNVEIIPILIPLTDWQTMDRLGKRLAQIISKLIQNQDWKLGKDIAVLCSTDGQHYGDYGWSYYDYHPFGCDAKGYEKATALDQKIINQYLVGELNHKKVHQFFASLVDQDDISHYKVNWCGRFSAPFATNFAVHLMKNVEDRHLTGYLLRYNTTLSDPWLPVDEYGLGLTGDANLHHFVTFAAVGFK